MQTQTSISPELSTLLHRELEPGERLLWSGVPDKRRIGQGEKVLTVIFGIYAAMMLTMGLTFSLIGRTNGPSGMFLVMGILFAAISASAGLAGRRRSNQTAYGITNRRVIILQGGKAKRVESIFPQNLSEMVRIEKQDGIGDLQLGSRLSGVQNNNGMMASQPVLAGIPDVKRVEQLIQETFLGVMPTTPKTQAQVAAEQELENSLWWTGNRG